MRQKLSERVLQTIGGNTKRFRGIDGDVIKSPSYPLS